MSPALVGFIRSLIYSVAVAGLTAVVEILNSGDEFIVKNPWLLALAPVVGRTIEGVIDKLNGQAPQKPLGSGPVDPDWYQKNYMGD